jgi:hypothetical protein
MEQRRAPDSRTIHLSYGRGLLKQCYPSGCFGLWNTKIWTSTWIIGRIRRKSSPARVGTIRTCHFSYRETLTSPYCLGPPRVVRQRCLTGASTGQTQGGNTDSCLRSSDRLSLLSIPPRALYRLLLRIEKPFTASRPERKSRIPLPLHSDPGSSYYTRAHCPNRCAEQTYPGLFCIDQSLREIRFKSLQAEVLRCSTPDFVSETYDNNLHDSVNPYRVQPCLK